MVKLVPCIQPSKSVYPGLLQERPTPARVPTAWTHMVNWSSFALCGSLTCSFIPVSSMWGVKISLFVYQFLFSWNRESFCCLGLNPVFGPLGSPPRPYSYEFTMPQPAGCCCGRDKSDYCIPLCIYGKPLMGHMWHILYWYREVSSIQKWATVH